MGWDGLAVVGEGGFGWMGPMKAIEMGMGIRMANPRMTTRNQKGYRSTDVGISMAIVVVA